MFSQEITATFEYLGPAQTLLNSFMLFIPQAMQIILIRAFQLVLLFFLLPPAFSQNRLCRIYGRVTDSVSMKPIEDVSVFIPFTSSGTITNSNGEFSLGQVPPGEVQVGFRHIAYAPATRLVNLRIMDSVRCDVPMAEATIEINEVVKMAGQIEWDYGYLLFKELLLGDLYETSCILKNPRDLSFYSDGNVIYGYARRPLKISNTYLGYDITYYLDYFKFDKNNDPDINPGRNQYFAFGGMGYYTDKDISSRIRRTKWKNNRESEFQGNLKDFLQDLYRQDSFWDKKYYLQKVQDEGTDSIFFWDIGQSKGSYIRYSHDETFPVGDSVLNQGPGPDLKKLSLPGPMLVFYSNPNLNDIPYNRVCLIELNQGTLLFDKQGNYHMEGGELNWIFLDDQKRLRNLLPVDYDPLQY